MELNSKITSYFIRRIIQIFKDDDKLSYGYSFRRGRNLGALEGILLCAGKLIPHQPLVYKKTKVTRYTFWKHRPYEVEITQTYDEFILELSEQLMWELHEEESIEKSKNNS